MFVKQKAILIAVFLAAFMFVSFVNSGNADFEIETMEPSYGGYEDRSGWLYHRAYVQTSEPYTYIYWYVNNKFVASTFASDNVTTDAYFTPSGYPGSHNGTTYTIKAKAWSIPDANGNVQTNTDSYDVVVYRTFHIVRLTDSYSTNGYDDGSGAYCQPLIETSEPYSSIDWEFDGVQRTTLGDGIKTVDSSNFFGPLSGTDVKGKKYTITATAKIPTGDGEFSATDSYTFIVYKPKVISGYKQPDVWEKPNVTGVYGYVQLSRHYHDGSNIVVDGYVYASNPTDNVACEAKSWFRQSEYDAALVPTGWEKQDPPIGVRNPATLMGPGEFYYDSGSSAISYPVKGGVIGKDQTIILNAHVHLQVTGNGVTDVWHELNHQWTHWFTYKDNASYEGGQ